MYMREHVFQQMYTQLYQFTADGRFQMKANHVDYSSITLWPSPWVSKRGWFSNLHTCLRAVNKRVTSGHNFFEQQVMALIDYLQNI